MPVPADWSYTVEHSAAQDGRMLISIESVPQYVLSRPVVHPACQFQVPPTPQIPFLHLPSQFVDFRPPPPPPIFPIPLTQAGLSAVQIASLSDIIPTATIVSIRDADNRVLCSVSTGRHNLTIAEFVLFLQYLVQAPLPPKSYLSASVWTSVREHFVGELGARGRAIWARYAAGTPRFGTPTGRNLLLGKTELWLLNNGLGTWIATMDTPRPRYQ